MEIPLRHATLGGQIEVYNGGRKALCAHAGVERGFRLGWLRRAAAGKAILLDERAYAAYIHEK
jgi:hypothetical protein